MAMLLLDVPTRSSRETERHRYLRPPERVYFPVEEEVPETNPHLERRSALYVSVKHEFAERATVGSEQFVYWDPTTAAKRLSPDVFVRMGVRHAPFDIWKTWQRGAPDLGVEIISASDARDNDWNEKLARYRSAGISEVVWFHAESRKAKLRIWDLIDGDLVERAKDDPNFHACETLGLWWVVVNHPEIGAMLRLARDREGRDLLPMPEEVAEREREKNKQLEAEIAALKAKLAEKKPRKRAASKKRASGTT